MNETNYYPLKSVAVPPRPRLSKKSRRKLGRYVRQSRNFVPADLWTERDRKLQRHWFRTHKTVQVKSKLLKTLYPIKWNQTNK